MSSNIYVDHEVKFVGLVLVLFDLGLDLMASGLNLMVLASGWNLVLCFCSDVYCISATEQRFPNFSG